MRRIVIPALGLLLALLSAGCQTWPAAGDQKYPLRRRLNAWETTVPLPIQTVHKAALAGLSDLDLQPITRRVDKLTGMVDGFLADGSDFEVYLESITETATRVRVRCGALGNRERSHRLFRAIESHL